MIGLLGSLSIWLGKFAYTSVREIPDDWLRRFISDSEEEIRVARNELQARKHEATLTDHLISRMK